MTADIISHHSGDGVSQQAHERKEECVNNILFLTRLWERFDEAFDELKRETKGLGDEELIGIIQCVINFFSCLEGLTDNVDIAQIQGLITQLFDKFLVQKVIDIASDFRHHENIADYKGIKQYFRELPKEIDRFINENPELKFNVYTTNYDGILETVFAKARPQGGSGFFAEDGFIRKISENSPFIALDRTRLENSKMKFLHLHGSYKFAKVFGMTCKISGPEKNKNPVMVFNRPTQKGNLVRGDDVLNTYFEKLRRDLSTCDKFIILGNSMKNEPHIKELLSNSIRPEATIVVCSRNPNEIRQEIAPHVRCVIEEATTRGIMNEDGLINFLKGVLV
ncbi:MAG: SIR2 family protein [Janthinobacterium lividum]